MENKTEHYEKELLGDAWQSESLFLKAQSHGIRRRRRSSTSTDVSERPVAKRVRPSATTRYRLTIEEKQALPTGIYFHDVNQVGCLTCSSAIHFLLLISGMESINQQRQVGRTIPKDIFGQ